MDLSPTGEPGLDPPAERVVLDRLVELTVVRHRMRSRSDQGHAPFQDIQELRQLVYAGPAQPFANPGHAAVGGPGLGDRGSILQHTHGPKLVDRKATAV